MTVFDALLLGLIQGVTEFLPISSTAHLTFAAKALHLIAPDHPEAWTAFMAVVQLGTVAAVLGYFRRDLIAIVSAFVEDVLVARRPLRDQRRETRMGWLIAMGTIPVVVLGLAFKHVIEGAFTKNLWVLGGSMVLFGLLLWASEAAARLHRGMESVGPRDSVLIGVAQACALVPGASRSGTTISAGLLLGLDRETAARFSFLLSVPAVFAAGVFELREALPHLGGAAAAPLALATLVAAVTGYGAIWFLLRYLRTHSTHGFVYYRLAGGAVILAALVLKFVQP